MKLVRDRIPNLMRARGHAGSFHLATPSERRQLLRAKLVEEVNEFLQATPGRAAEELVDILEVVAALADALGINQTDLEVRRREKAAERGAFTFGVVWHDQAPASREVPR
jgi:predicted house-cleaning noncanonical NTP pyrophosphatase (MazG superfamily)